ncbi:MAG: FAD-dependent monooxygenase [Candidatus Sericytochromatia bacterium]|nr:FAD-dependent monooxygenase [Candidatus Sericytochromatia bacterium]
MKVLIVGAGIGGLGAALALEKKGINVEVFEAAPAIRAVGAGLWVAPNGLEILNRIQPALKQAVIQAGWELQASTVEDLHGHKLSGFNAQDLRCRYGSGPLAIRRSALHAILMAALKQTPLHTGKRFQAYDIRQGQVAVQFEDGSSATGDLLIGADGLRSRVRTQLWGEIPLRYSGQSCWRGLAPLRLPEPWHHKAQELWGDRPGLRAGFSQVNADEVYFYLTQSMPAGQHDSPEHLKPDLLRAFADFPERVLQIIQATPTEAFLRNDLSDFVPLKSYGQGPIWLLGDAAHATTPNLGQGANQALESAWALAESLAPTLTPRDLEQALQHYQSCRLARARFITETSWKIGQISNLKHGLRLRNWLMAHLPEQMVQRQLDQVFRLA